MGRGGLLWLLPDEIKHDFVAEPTEGEKGEAQFQERGKEEIYVCDDVLDVLVFLKSLSLRNIERVRKRWVENGEEKNGERNGECERRMKDDLSGGEEGKTFLPHPKKERKKKRKRQR